MTGQNRLLGLEDSISFNEFFENKNKYKLLDVRELKEYKSGSIIDAELKPIDEFRDTIDEIPKDKPVAVYCKGGYRGYLAQRILNQNGFEVRNLDGGFLTGEMLTKS